MLRRKPAPGRVAHPLGLGLLGSDGMLGWRGATQLLGVFLTFAWLSKDTRGLQSNVDKEEQPCSLAGDGKPSRSQGARVVEQLSHSDMV